jgi:hypothetical protein
MPYGLHPKKLIGIRDSGKAGLDTDSSNKA